MPMGIVSDNDFEAELDRLKPTGSSSDNETPPEKGVIQDVTRGRPTGATEVPEGIRKLIGDESITNGRQSALQLAAQFGISASSVSAYAVGATSTSTYDKRPNQPTVDGAKLRIQSKARHKLIKALASITDDKLEAAKARDLAGIAKDMSAVIKNMEPERTVTEMNNSNNPTFVFYSPQTKREENFPVIQVKE